MVTYEYICPHCGHEFTADRLMIERDKRTQCPRCKRLAVRIVSAAGTVYNCRGFYATDSRGKGDAE